MKFLQHIAIFIIGLMIAFQYYQINQGNHYERVECWKQGGVLFNSLGTLICIQPETQYETKEKR